MEGLGFILGICLIAMLTFGKGCQVITKCEMKEGKQVCTYYMKSVD